MKHRVEVAPMAGFQSFVDVFDHWAEVQPERCAVRAEGEELSWLQLQELSRAVASHVWPELQGEEVVALLARRSGRWLAATLGLMRCGVAFVWMGAGEVSAREKERQRNEEVMRLVAPRLVLLGPADPLVVPEAVSACRQLLLEQLLLPKATAPPPPTQALLCLQLTGGTTGCSKCVEVTHAMALHEVTAYRQSFPELGVEDRVLQHTAVLWAASAIGQINIAVSFGATLCISKGLDQQQVASATVLGCVPSSLEALEPRAPLRFVFVWGEALSPQRAARWRSFCRVVELLIRRSIGATTWCFTLLYIFLHGLKLI